jgi:Ser-tRNA(Ala) deacylase AlaX
VTAHLANCYPNVTVLETTVGDATCDYLELAQTILIPGVDGNSGDRGRIGSLQISHVELANGSFRHFLAEPGPHFVEPGTRVIIFLDSLQRKRQCERHRRLRCNEQADDCRNPYCDALSFLEDSNV